MVSRVQRDTSRHVVRAIRYRMRAHVLRPACIWTSCYPVTLFHSQFFRLLSKAEHALLSHLHEKHHSRSGAGQIAPPKEKGGPAAVQLCIRGHAAPSSQQRQMVVSGHVES